MKKRLLSLFLAVLMVAAVFVPLMVTANAASEPVVRMIWEDSEYGHSYREYAPSQFTQLGSEFSGEVTASVTGTTVAISLNNFQRTGAIGTYYGIHVQVPNNKWTVTVNAVGENKLSIQGNSYISPMAALSTNGDLYLFTASTGSTLSVYGNVGTSEKQVKVTSDIYGLYGHSIDVGGLRPDTRLRLNVYFDLYLTGFTSKVIFPFYADKSEKTTIEHADFTYNHFSNYGHYYDSNSRIELDSNTYFNTVFYTTTAPSQNYCYHTVTYRTTFTGVMNAEVKNAIFAGGPYGGEGVEGGKQASTVFGQMHQATYGDTTYYHKVAKNCKIGVTQIPSETLKSAFSFPLDYGYTLPGRIERSTFYAVIQWTDQYGTDVTDKKVEYAKKYRAIITIVPKRTNIQSVNLAGDINLIRPAGTYGGGVLENGVFAPKLYLDYTAVQRPALTITKQPVDYAGSGSNKQARFSIDASDATATYQWQKSTDNKTWTDISDKYTSSGSTQIVGSKSKNLTYDFNQVDVGTTLMYFRCIVSRASDGQSKTSNVVKYTYTASTTTVSQIVIGGFNSQVSESDGFYDSPYVLIDGVNASWGGGGDNYKVQIVDHFWYEGEAGASSAAKTTESKFAAGKTYTYRIKIRPVAGKSTFASAMTIEQDGNEKKPDHINKYTDGTWEIDFTYGPIGTVIRRISLYDIVPPYNGMGFIDPTVRDNAYYKLNAGFTRGWFIPGTDNMPAGIPQIGEQYYMSVFLSATEGNEFSAQNKKPSVSIQEMRDRDGFNISADKYEYEFSKKSDGSPDFRYLIITLTFTCKETHISKGGTIKDLDRPTAGVPLDTDVTLSTPQIDFQEMIYYINGDKVADPAKTAPEEGDIVEIQFTFKEYGEGETKMHFDKSIYTTWYVGGNEPENGERVYRDMSYPDENIAAFTYVTQVEAAAAHKITVTGGKADKETAKPGETVTVTADPAPEGKVFDKWEIEAGTPEIANPTKATVTFPMPNHDVALKATYKEKGGETETVMLGDVDNDTKITASDARLALRRAVELESYAEGSREYIACDVDRDTKVTASDARSILRGAVGLENPADW